MAKEHGQGQDLLGSEVCEAAQISKKTLDSWRRRGYIKPKGDHRPGHPHRYGPEALTFAKLMKNEIDAGATAAEAAGRATALAMIDEYESEMEKETDARRCEFRRAAKKAEGLPLTERAAGLLNHWATTRYHWGDEEAVVFLRSRGYPWQTIAEGFREKWREHSRNKIDTSSEHCRHLSRSQLEAVEEVSELDLPNFWHPNRYNRHYVNWAMIRAVEWCHIGGFDEWWRRLFQSETDEIYGSAADIESAYSLLAVSRSRRATQELARPLARLYEALENGIHSTKVPWRCISWLGPSGMPKEVDHTIVASAILFGATRIPGVHGTQAVLDRAINFLIKSQRDSGGWPIWASDTKESVEATAFAVHALSASARAEAAHALRDAQRWLEEAAHHEGYWQENACPDPVFLSVLALDAIELAGNGTRTTLDPGCSVVARKRFAVAVSFAGEIRSQVEAIALTLATAIGRESILYDKFHEAEFARPNLDTHLQDLYRNETDLVVVVLSADYQSKTWCGLEWRAIRALMASDEHRIMFLKIGSFTLPGFFHSVDGFIDIEGAESGEVANKIIARHQLLTR